jgi:hypothetical protein
MAIRDYIEVRDNLGALLVGAGLFAIPAVALGIILWDTLVGFVSGKFGMAGLIVLIIVLGWYAARENARVRE